MEDQFAAPPIPSWNLTTFRGKKNLEKNGLQKNGLSTRKFII
jgi:hypothetical protein